MSHIAFRPIFLTENHGHGSARKVSIESASYDLVALMDADDVSLPDRFLKQLSMFIENDELDVCGGQITEFDGEESNIIGRREVCLSDPEIKRDLKKRCPMNQVTVMFRKESYIAAGGYIDWYCEEDYYLWARMIQKGLNFRNVNDDVVNVRIGLEMSSRRGGWKYFLSERRMQKYLLETRMISCFRYLYNVLIRFAGEVILPNPIRNYLFRFIRKAYVPIVDNGSTYEKKDVDLDKLPPFSVAMCVYGQDHPDWFDRALKSIIEEQTIKPDEIVLVVDGPIPKAIEDVIHKYADICETTGI